MLVCLTWYISTWNSAHRHTSNENRMISKHALSAWPLAWGFFLSHLYTSLWDHIDDHIAGHMYLEMPTHHTYHQKIPSQKFAFNFMLGMIRIKLRISRIPSIRMRRYRDQEWIMQPNYTWATQLEELNSWMGYAAELNISFEMKYFFFCRSFNCSMRRIQSVREWYADSRWYWPATELQMQYWLLILLLNCYTSYRYEIPSK
jgi:hypothetical protein